MIWKKAELAALPCLEPPKNRNNVMSPLWAAAIVDYQGEQILQIEVFEHTGARMLRHWVAPGCEKYISLRENGTWSKALLTSQEPIGNPLYIEHMPQENKQADDVLTEWDKGLGKWRNPLQELVSKERNGSANKRWTQRRNRKGRAMELFYELKPEDLEPSPQVRAAAREAIKNNWGAKGWMLYWPYKVKEPITGLWYKCQKGFCTVCKAQTELWPEDVPEGEKTIGHCPICGETVRFCRSSKASRAEIAVKTVQFRKASTGAALAVQYLTGVWYSVTVQGRERKIVEHQNTQAINLAIFDAKMTVSISGCEGMRGGWQYTGNWHAEDSMIELWGTVLPIRWQELVGTPLENSHVWDYAKTAHPNLIRYCAQYMKYPGMENLMSSGLIKILDDLAMGYKAESRLIDRKQTSPAKMLGLTKLELDRARNEKWGLLELGAYKWLRDRALPVDVDEVRHWAYSRTDGKMAEVIAACAGDKAGEKMLYQYIKRQARRYGRQDTWVASIYVDYIQFAKKLGYNMDDLQNRYPPKLKEMHDRMSEQVQQQKDSGLNNGIAKVAAALERFAWEKNGLFIRPARTAAELRNEGKLLHHCVGTYAKSYAEGRTALFFIRRAEQPEIPYYTLELNEKNMTVVQNHGDHNAPQTPEIKAFEQKWLAWAKKQEAARRAEEKKARLADDCKKTEKEHAA